MANNKIGFNFYGADTDRHQDIRMKKLKKNFGCNGFAVYEYILCEIYRVKGCFIVWDDSTTFDVADYWGLKETSVNEIVSYCCTVGLFDKGLFASESVLTSAAIQTRFVEWSKIAKRKNCKIPEKYFKLQEVSTKIHEETIQNSGVLPQREREENVEREEGGREDAHAREEAFTPPSVSDVESFFKEQIPDTFWSFEKCTVESKKFFNYYEKYGWKTRNGPIVKWENAASGWIDNDGKFEEEKKIKNNQKSKFPDVYDRSFAEKASADVLKQYFEHIKSLGWYMEGRDGRGQSVWKKAEI